jgi:hypothetical protein
MSYLLGHSRIHVTESYLPNQRRDTHFSTLYNIISPFLEVK